MSNYKPRFVKKHGICKDLAHPYIVLGDDELVELVEDYRELVFLLLNDLDSFEVIDKKIGDY